jgi:hypothetical protein
MFGRKTRFDPQDVGIAIFLDDFTTESCGMRHPQLDGNNCELTEGHIPETHMDAAGNEWIGNIYE